MDVNRPNQRQMAPSTVECPFWQRIGACMRGNRCPNRHTRVKESRYLKIPYLYPNPKLVDKNVDIYGPDYMTHLDIFFLDVFSRIDEIAQVSRIVVADNLCSQLVGAVYVEFFNEQDAKRVQKEMYNTAYFGIKIKPSLSPIKSFRTALCKDFHHSRRLQCPKGDNCSYIHSLLPSPQLLKELYAMSDRRWGPPGGQLHPLGYNLPPPYAMNPGMQRPRNGRGNREQTSLGAMPMYQGPRNGRGNREQRYRTEQGHQRYMW